MRSTACDDNLGATVAGQGRARPTLRLLQTRCLPGIASRRRGLTLLEVLIAIFVLLFGLLGVLALIPVAMYRMNQALTADRATAVAQAAMEEIKVRGMLDPAMWVRRNSGSWALVTTATFGASYAIDPWFIAQTTADATDPTAFDTANAQYFPCGAAAPFRMERVSFDRRVLSTDPLLPMTVAGTQRVFVSHDDLMVDTPEDTTLRPRLAFSTTSGSYDPAGTSPAVNEIEGHYSWLATVAQVGANEFNVAVAVFRDRDMSLPTATAAIDPNKYGERVVGLELLGGGVGGGEFRLSATSAAQLSALPGDWMLLCGTGNIFCWYRIVSLGEVQPGFTREVTLAGPDWNPDWDSTPSVPSTGAQAVLFTNLVLVRTETVQAN